MVARIGAEGAGKAKGKGKRSWEEAVGVACLECPGTQRAEGCEGAAEVRKVPLLTLNAIEANLATGDPSCGR